MTRAERGIDAHSLAVARIAFGALAVASAIRTLAYGWVEVLWLEPDVHLTWSWLAPPVPPAPVLYGLVVVLGALGGLVAVGAWTRPAAALWAAGFAWLELLDKATWLNHYWAMTLVAVLLAAVPTDRVWALRPGRAGRRGVMAPAWHLWLLRSQVAVVYVFAGVAKLDADWLLRGEPMATWLRARTDLPVVGPLLGEPTTAVALSWFGLLFDLTIVLWLWWRPTRIPALLAVVAFHTATWLLFPIGVFPWVMIGLATLWLPPDWPRRVHARIRQRQPTAAVATPRPASTPRWHLVLAAAWVLVQVALPLRHLAVPGDVRWTEESGRFAWRVMAEDKVGWAVYRVSEPNSGRTWRVPVTDILEPWQARIATVRPDMLLQVAHVIAERWSAEHGVATVEVRVDAWVAWNGRASARLVDPEVDLAARPRHAGHHSWILEPPT